MINKFKQFFKFLVTGGNNTALDFLILNILMKIFNVYSGGLVILFNCLSFSIAVSNSYLVNRFWTFKQKEDRKIKNIQIVLIMIILLMLFFLKFIRIDFLLIFLIIIFLSLAVSINIYIIKNYLRKDGSTGNSLEFGKFVFLTLIGMAINSAILYFLTSFIEAPFGFSNVIWANFAKAIATVITLFWNFFSYKVFIFKN